MEQTLKTKISQASIKAGSFGSKPAHSNKRRGEAAVEKILILCAAIFILAIFLITLFIFAKGLPLIAKIGIVDFLFNTQWSPTKGIFGIGSMFIGSVLITFGALIWTVPLGLSTAILMAEIAPPKIGTILGDLVNLLAGIPSVVYGFIGLIVVVPFIRDNLGGNGMSLLAGAIILGIMILPTLINISRDSILAVPHEYKEGSLALGATHFQTISKVIVPAAKSGIITAIVLGMGRAIGETMAVVMVTGNSPIIPGSILEPVRTMTSNIVLEMGYASGDHQTALFATGMVLFVFIVVLNLSINLFAKGGQRSGSN